MNSLIECYLNKTLLRKGDEFEQFSSFFNGNLVPIEDWLKKCFKNKLNKNNEVSNSYRNDGNVYYGKKLFKKAVSSYTKSLRFATFNSDSYGLALANRSAALFMMEDYENCLKDIHLCLKSAYPNDLKIKVLMRQAECYCILKKDDLMNQTITDIKVHLQDTEETVKKKQYEEALSKIGRSAKKVSFVQKAFGEDLPQFDGGEENKTFPGASTLIRIGNNEQKGRHVVADRRINEGDTLFIEKCFISAPIFSEDKEFNNELCYNCLKNTPHLIPCRHCTRCLFCSQTCLECSWENFHRWECAGMQTDLFYESGIAFPALKALLKGSKTDFNGDGYRNFDELLTHFSDITNTLPLLILSSVIVLYLKNYTDFFVGRDSTFIKNVGGKIVRHIAQLSCNSSVIKHWEFDCESLPGSAISVACGIYPSISIMNHSCNPNVSLYYINDVAVVKALKTITPGEEVFNCYGIDYRYLNKEDRRKACESIYYFTCNCDICCDPSKEIDSLDVFKCINCASDTKRKCASCRNNSSMTQREEILDEVTQLLKNADTIEDGLKIAESILAPNHSFLITCYDTLFLHCVQTHLNEAYEYFIKSISIKKNRLGKNSRSIGIDLLKAVSIFIEKFKDLQLSEFKKHLKLFKQIEEFHERSKEILQLYYQSDRIKSYFLDDELAKIKMCISYKQENELSLF